MRLFYPAIDDIYRGYGPNGERPPINIDLLDQQLIVTDIEVLMKERNSKSAECAVPL